MKTTSLLEDLKNLLGQNYCFFCGKIEEIVCTKCTIDLFKYSAIQYIQNVPVLSMTSNSYTFSNLISAHKDKGLANLKEPFAEIISVGLKHFSKHKNTIVVNVPSTTFAIQKRGLDPISLMTERACEMAGRRFIYENNLLLNRSKRQDQAGLNFRQRKENMHDGFNVGFYTSKPVIIVDDLITTGASLDQSIYSLTKQRIKVKACVVLAANILVKP